MSKRTAGARKLDARHSFAELKRRSVAGAFVTTTSRVLLLGLNLASTMILARILTPADFGLVAMALVFTGFAALFQEAGLSAATIQKETLSRQELSTVFWLNLLLSAGVTALLIAVAPLLAKLYDEPRLTYLAMWLALEFVINGLGMQHLALLKRQLRYTAISVVEVCAFLVGAVAAVIWATYDASYWALVVLMLGRATTKSLLAWALARWRPGVPQSYRSVMSMIKFGANLTGFKALNYFSSNLDQFLLGRIWGAEALGFYSRAYHLLQLPLGQINLPIAQVAVPALSRLQSRQSEYRTYYYRAMETIACIGKPLVVFLFVCAEPLISIVLGDRWLDSAPIFRGLALGAFLGVTNVAAGWIYVTLGRTDRQLIFELMSLPVRVACIVIGAIYWGAVGAALGVSVSRAILYVPLRLWAFKNTPISFSGFLGSIQRPIIASLVAGGVVYASTNTFLDSVSSSVEVSYAGLVGGAVYLAIYTIQPGGRLFLLSSYSAVSALKRR